jgi:2-oxo-4-hydroxy-4-carboxy-5-ureidoimidazoline decarboxylase
MELWQTIDASVPDEARRLLRACCGSTRWVEQMLGRRPFHSQPALIAAAREEWFKLGADDWREAFSHHPKIGDREALERRFPESHGFSSREQAGVAGASAAVLDALLEGNREYEQKFGHIFIVCASGRKADEMLALLRERLGNDPSTELRLAAEEQAKITELRLSNDCS